MTEKTHLKKEIFQLIKQFYTVEQPKEQFIPGKTRIPLIAPSYGWQEVCGGLESILDGRVTMGEKVKRFESLFAEYVGLRYGVMVNSGSSANLLGLAVLTNPLFKNHLRPGDEVITPALTWATTVFPIVNCGLIPVLVDVDMETFDIKPEEIRKAIGPRTRAIMPVHLLGNPCQKDQIMALAEANKLFVLEDTCEAHGAEFGGKKAGSFGDLATFSFYFSHHLSTIEGGIIVTENEEIYELARSLRMYGRIRDLKDQQLYRIDRNTDYGILLTKNCVAKYNYN